MYITTSRKPSLSTKRLCRALSAIIPFAFYENRGRKGIEEVAARADSLGKERALLVYEQHGNPARILFMEIRAGGWKWLSPEIFIRKVKLSKSGKKFNSIEIAGERKGELARLLKPLAPEESEEEEKVLLSAGNERLTFADGKKPVLELEVEYYEGKGGD